MKKYKFQSVLIALFAMISLLTVSCVDDDFDTPPTTLLPIGEVTTIQDLKTSFLDNTIDVDMTIYATVTMDDKSGNIYKTAYIQDETGAIALHLDAAGGIYQGDSIRLQLNGLKIGKYKELYQIDAPDGNGFTLDNYITKIKTLVNVEPDIVTINDINTKSAEYQCELIKLENVQFIGADTAATYADADGELSRDLVIEDASGNTVVVRSSGFAKFADENVPNGNGSLIAIVGQYNSTMQLYIRTSSEVIMENERIGGGGGTVDGEGSFDTPYNVASGIANQGTTGIWVEGYMVGVYETLDASGADLSEFTPSFTAPFNTPYNVIIADDANETNIANCLIIKLTSGEIRNTLNLVDNADNKGKQVKTYGNLTSYFGKSGQQDVSGYWFEDAGINPDVPASTVVLGTSTVVSSLNESFTSVSANANFEASGWLNANKLGERYWQGKVYTENGYIQATSYNAVASDIESWIVTPGVELTTAKKLNFDSNSGYYKHAGLTVWVSTDFDGDNSNLFTSTWTQINPTISVGPSDAYGEWVNSGDVDLSAYSGTIYVLFKYVGNNTTNTTTFQIDNVQIVDL